MRVTLQRSWSNRIRRPATLLAGAVMLLLAGAGCGDGPSAIETIEDWHGEPFVSGRIERRPVSSGDRGYLVQATTAPGADPVGAYFHVGSGTELVWEGGEAATEDALQVGQQVSVWVKPGSIVLESLPPQVEVSRVLIHHGGRR